MGSTAIEDMFIVGDTGYWMHNLKKGNISVDIHIRNLYKKYLTKYS